MIRTRFAWHRSPIRRPAWFIAACSLALSCPIALAGGRGPKTKAPPKDHEAGHDLFMKVWEPGKPSPSGGDGLGPLYNETSCAACHRLGGIGGGGRNEQNVRILTAEGGGGQTVESGKTYVGELEDLHFGFLNGISTVLHRHSTNPSDEERISEINSFKRITTHDRRCNLRTSERNTPAVFGDGLIDEIPAQVLNEAEKRTFPGFPDIKGRANWLPDGRVGRFGWKAQTSTLREFVLAACANEQGLEVPGHHQARLDRAEESATDRGNLDMTKDQCEQLVDYVASLSPPVLRPVGEGRRMPWGYWVFEQVGCATCHTPRLGRVNGVYSDLLLHDMGESLADAATTYGGSTSAGNVGSLADAREQARAAGSGALSSEWRTPPLWGVAESAPYMHDGRAATLDEAIRLHGGEAAAIAARYGKLERGDQRLLIQFLLSLTVAPPVDRRAAAIDAIQARARVQRKAASPE